MVVPNPLPPKRRVVDWSAWVKLSKILDCASGAMPMPVSRIENLSRTFDSVSACTETCTVTLPASVNLTALPARLINTWRRWCGSPRTAGGTSGMSETTNSTPFAAACAATMRQVLFTSACRSKSVRSSTTLPASIFEKSSTSSIRPSITREEPRSVCSMSACSRLSCVSRSRSAMPLMALSGVRSSWLTTETKRRLARLAASARAIASNIRRTSDSTYRLTALMPISRPMPSAVCARQKSFT